MELVMNAYPVDLHVHSVMSDGEWTPEELVAEAAARQMEAIALTDHDTTAGIDAAIEAGKMHHIRIVEGIDKVRRMSKRQRIDTYSWAECQRLFGRDALGHCSSLPLFAHTRHHALQADDGNERRAGHSRPKARRTPRC